MADQPPLMREMATAAMSAARTAAGEVIGGRIAAAHPDLPALEWTGVRWDVAGKKWTAIGEVPPAYSAADARKVVEAYAKALGGLLPQMAPGGVKLETETIFEGVPVTVSGRVRAPSCARWRS